jgi:hypothetical protein
MSVRPISRIYFDSNCAFGWPVVSKDFHWVTTLSRWLSIELCWPEAVEIELEAQFVRCIKEESEKITTGEKRIIKRLRGVEAGVASRFEVDLESVIGAYRQKTAKLKADLGIQPISTVGPILAEIVRQAAHRTPPFEEFPRSKSTAVTGFQDAVILSSILADLADRPCSAAFASQDSVFSGASIKAQIQDRGLDLWVYEHLKALGDELWDRVAPAIRDGWEQDFVRAGEAVEANLVSIEGELLNIIDLKEIGKGESAEVIQVRSLKIKKLTTVTTELPEVQSLPPYSVAFNRKAGPTIIEATAWVDFHTIVRPYLGLVAMLIGQKMGQPAQPSEAKEEDRTIFLVVDLVLEAQYDGNKYGQLRLVSAVVQG